MAKQEQIERSVKQTDTAATVDQTDAQAKVDTEKLKADLDSILDEIEEVLEDNAVEFVKSYVQRGGQ